ncbi:hypothetical protein LQF61_07325, partial [Tetragenococcus koreensis]|uniref:FGGY-family carbohydrate kinase n=1 Tax=Tetragenococcus koreensis TaxID=290335 RepID=UPI0022863459
DRKRKRTYSSVSSLYILFQNLLLFDFILYQRCLTENPQMHTRAHMLRAVLEGIVYNLYTVLLALEEVVGQPKSILATGGFARSELWRQMLSDVFERPVTVPQAFESSCLGAAVVGMKSIGVIDELAEVRNFVGKTETYAPNPDHFDVYRELVPIYIRLTRQLKTEYQTIADFQHKYAQKEPETN